MKMLHRFCHVLVAVILIATMVSASRTAEKVVTRESYTYEGGVVNGKFQGYGVCRYRNGNTYYGYWNQDFKEGLGKMIYADGRIEFGTWRRGKPVIPKGQKYSPGKTVYGIDVAKYQGVIDWTALGLRCNASGTVFKSGGKDTYLQPVLFAFMKSTQGTTIIDPYFKRNFKEAKRAGIVRGAYHFLTPGFSAREQADYFIANTPLEKGDLPPVLDLEIRPSVMKARHKEILKLAKDWCKIIEKHYGCKPIIYTYDNYYRDYLHGHGFDHYDLWIARYHDDSPAAKHWEFWQFTDKGRTRGIPSHTVDIDRFKGDYQTFIKYVKKKGVQR